MPKSHTILITTLSDYPNCYDISQRFVIAMKHTLLLLTTLFCASCTGDGRPTAIPAQDPSPPSSFTGRIEPDLSGIHPHGTVFEHSFDCRPLNINDVMSWPDNHTELTLPVRCEVHLQVASDGHSDIKRVTCSDQRWVAHTRTAFEQVIWTTEEKGQSCFGVTNQIVWPVIFTAE